MSASRFEQSLSMATDVARVGRSVCVSVGVSIGVSIAASIGLSIRALIGLSIGLFIGLSTGIGVGEVSASPISAGEDRAAATVGLGADFRTPTVAGGAASSTASSFDPAHRNISDPPALNPARDPSAPRARHIPEAALREERARRRCFDEARDPDRKLEVPCDGAFTTDPYARYDWRVKQDTVVPPEKAFGERLMQRSSPAGAREAGLGEP